MTKTIQELLAEKPENNDPQPIQYVETVEAYDKWAEVYDTDGNYLQRLDTIEMRALLPRFLDRVYSRFQIPAGDQSGPLTLLDLGCGTGRNTIQLLEVLTRYHKEKRTDVSSAHKGQVVGLDASLGMLEVAQSAIRTAIQRGDLKDSPEVSLDTIDLLQPPSDIRARLPPSLQSSGAAGVISTLVLEHIPTKEFFQAASATMRPGGYLLVTNMHEDMGKRSQAGFTDPKTGVKIRPTSYCHTIAEVLAAAEEAGFQVEDIVGEEGQNGVLERDVNEHLAEKLGARAKKWIGIRVWFGVCFSKR